jgi:heme A synthase
MMMPKIERKTHFPKYAWGVLAYNVLVVLWGALVRATSSGAGCGQHWPLCNGVVLPEFQKTATAIEFVHRMMSGIALVVVVGLLIWAFRVYPKGHPVRLGATLSMVFIITEALVGAGLVLFQWVAQDASLGRTISIAIHLVNTFLLLGSLALTGWWASGGQPLHLKGQGWLLAGLLIGLFGVLVIGITGSITALGDTLFPASSLAQGMQQDFSPTAHFLIRLRFWHPVTAILVGFYLVFISLLLALLREDPKLKRIASILVGLVVLQFCAGLVNLFLLAPVPMQIIHLLIADSLWITLILFSAVVFGEPSVQISESPENLAAKTNNLVKKPGNQENEVEEGLASIP